MKPEINKYFWDFYNYNTYIKYFGKSGKGDLIHAIITLQLKKAIKEIFFSFFDKSRTKSIKN